MKQWLKNFTHNCIIHPLMSFLPKKLGNQLHDSNANWAFNLNKDDKTKTEVIVLLDRFQDKK